MIPDGVNELDMRGALLATTRDDDALVRYHRPNDDVFASRLPP